MSTVQTYTVPFNRSTRIHTRRTTYIIKTRGPHQGTLSHQRQVRIVQYARGQHYARVGGLAGAALFTPALPVVGAAFGVHTGVARSVMRDMAGGNDVAVYKHIQKHSGKTVTRKVFKTKSARSFGKTAYRNRNVPPNLTKAQRQQMARRRRRVKGKFA